MGAGGYTAVYVPVVGFIIHDSHKYQTRHTTTSHIMDLFTTPHNHVTHHDLAAPQRCKDYANAKAKASH